MENSEGETIIRGHYGTSVNRKDELEFSIDFLLYIVATSEPLEVVEEHSVAPPPDIARNRTDVALIGKEKSVPTRSPVSMPLFRNAFAGVIKLDDDSVLIMTKAYRHLT